MSKIFEALQRFDPEGSSVPFLDEPTLTAEVLQVPSRSCLLAECPRLAPSLSGNTRIVCLQEPVSLAAEQFRLLSVRIRNLAQQRELKRLLITSSAPEEGKSVCATNLACSLARNKQRKVLLLEGDLRRPTIRKTLGLPPLHGLCEWLAGTSEASSAIYEIEPGGFWFMPAGAAIENPLELMQPGKLSRLFDELTAIFDWIIIDTPPVVPLADTTLWSRYADGTLLVIREGATQKRELRKAIEGIDPTSFVGVVLNGSTQDHYHGYYHYYAPRPGSSEASTRHVD